jgi:hypothetical protein
MSVLTTPITTAKRLTLNMKQGSRSFDQPARKYCFRATTRLIDASGRPLGVFTGYDTSVDIAKGVQDACALFSSTLMPGETRCEEAEVILHRECPVEITHEICFARIVDVDEQ